MHRALGAVHETRIDGIRQKMGQEFAPVERIKPQQAVDVVPPELQALVEVRQERAQGRQHALVAWRRPSGIVAAPRQWQRQKDWPGQTEAKLLPCPSAHERHQLAGLRQGRIRRGQMEVQARGLRRQGQVHDGVGHVVHWHQVDRLGPAGRHQRQPPGQVEAQGKV